MEKIGFENKTSRLINAFDRNQKREQTKSGKDTLSKFLTLL